MSYAFLDHPGPIPYAHRGGALEGLENTMPAFEAAVALGYRYLETDARVTADGVLLAFHDDDLSRTCGRPGLISELPWSEVKTARVGGKEPIPLMEDVLGTFPDRRINLDAEERCRRRPDDRRHPPDRQPGAGLRRRVHGPTPGRGPQGARSEAVHVDGTARGRPLAHRELPPRRARHAEVPVAQVPLTKGPVPVVTGWSVRAAAAKGIQVHVWTIDEAAEMERLLDLGVRGIITDRPHVLKEILQRRGQWFE